MGTEPTNVANGQVWESNKAAHTKLKSRHLYMIAMGGKRTARRFDCIRNTRC